MIRLDSPGGGDRPRDRPFPGSRDSPRPVPDNPPRAASRPEVWPDKKPDQPERTHMPDWVKRIEDGNKFNRDNHHRYHPMNEIVLDSGKRVDSLGTRPGREIRIREIVSRKFTQLDAIQEKTAIGYLDEARAKYSPGEVIKDSDRNKTLGIGGKTLRGRLILEVPPQNSVPEAVLRHAAEHRIIIRDTDGKIYRLGQEGK